MKFSRSLLLIGAACFNFASTPPASAWGWQGHEYVGAVAFKLLNPNARRHVKALLGPGLDLSLAAVWADCAKNVSGPPNYKLNPRNLAAVCNQFSAAERQEMWSYTRKNWSNCEYAHKATNCHKAFHFADVNVHEHADYDASYFGAQHYDVVHAIDALVTKLKCDDAEACDLSPFPGDIESRRDALILLAHFVGYLHQPLHVGAVYLDPNNSQETGDSGLETIGGNALLLTPGSTDNLHHKWDTVSSATPTTQAIAQACLIAPLPNPTPEPVESWASESVAAARIAYSGMSFTPDTEPAEWDIQFADSAAYNKAVKRVQAQQLIKGGARLAALLNSIWPSTRKAAACR